MTLPEHIAEAVLDLLKSIPNPEKADLEVCIRRAMEINATFRRKFVNLPFGEWDIPDDVPHVDQRAVNYFIDMAKAQAEAARAGVQWTPVSFTFWLQSQPTKDEGN